MFELDSSYDLENIINSTTNLYTNHLVLTRYITRGSFIKNVADKYDKKKYVNNIDHDFIVFAVGGEYYLMQSYYYAYLFTGLHGFKQLSLEEYLVLNRCMYEINTVINEYLKLDHNNQDFDVKFEKITNIININKQKIAAYTGIESNKHGADVDFKDEPYMTVNNYLVPIQEQYLNLLINRINSNICVKAKQVLEKYKSRNNLKFEFDYFVYDAFNPKSIEGDRECFNKLTGFDIQNLNPITTSNEDKTIHYYPIKFTIPVNIMHRICQNITNTFKCTNITECVGGENGATLPPKPPFP